LYEHATVSASIRERFVTEVQRITWAYKLAEVTINLRGDATVPEIQVFVLDAKGEDVSDDVLATIDKAVPFPIVFEVNRDAPDRGATRMVAGHKQVRGATSKLSAYCTTGWQFADASRVPLPTALDLPSLYTELFKPMLPIEARVGENVAESADRLAQARKLEREVAALEKRLRAEPQLNRKIELRRQLRDRTDALNALRDPARRENEDATWTS
jgi:hypothetical protein